MSRKVLSVLLIVAALVSFVAMVEAAEPEVIKIGVYEPMTGAMAAGGQQTWEGIELAKEQVKEVLGKPIEVVLVDNKSEKTEAANAMARLIDAEKWSVWSGATAASLSMAGGEVSEKAGSPGNWLLANQPSGHQRQAVLFPRLLY